MRSRSASRPQPRSDECRMPNAKAFGVQHLPFGIDMILARVVGTVVATRKDERLVSSKLLIARPMDPAGKAEGAYLVPVYTGDAGFGETGLIRSGSSAPSAAGLKELPVSAPHLGL